MKIILQCDCTGSDGAIQDLTTILLSLKSESRYLVLNKTHHEKKQHIYVKQRKKPISPSRKIKKSNVRCEYCPTVGKTVFNAHPRY